MRKSIVNPKFEYREDVWLVSVLNSDGAVAGLTGGGHVMIVVEGLEKDHTLRLQPYFRQCDFLAPTTEEDDDGSIINTKGRIVSIRCYTTTKRDFDYSKVPSKTHIVDPLRAKDMIASILKDKEICEKAARGERDEEKKLIEYPRYQKVGTNHFLSEVGMGENCASWAIRHLAVAGIDETSSKSKPKKVAGKGCILM